MPDPFSVGNDQIVRQVEEQSMFDYSSSPTQFLRKRSRILDRAEGAIQNKIPTIRPISLAVGILPAFNLRSQLRKEWKLSTPSKGQDLYR